MTVIAGPCSTNVCILYVEGPLLEPLNGELRHNVQAILSRGKRSIVLDLIRVSTIDAAGVGELVRAHNMTIAPNGVIQIVHVTPWVGEMLQRAGLLEMLTTGDVLDSVKSKNLV
jgi:anti-anti-sigma factor